jgi:hypothetical protein
MDKTRSCLFRGGRIIGIHAEQDDFQLRIGFSKQTTGFGGGRTVESPIEQEQVWRRICQFKDERLHILDFDNAVCPQFAL